MKNHSFLILFLFLIEPISTRAQSANCHGDSTVVIYSYSDYSDSPGIPNPFPTPSVYHYNLDYGIVTNPDGTISFWQKKDTIYNGNGFPDSILTFSGSLNGWYISNICAFSYSISGKCTGIINLYNSNNTWDTLDFYSYNYDALDRLTSEEFKSKSSNVWTYNKKLVYDYTPDFPYSTTLLKGNQQTWTNDSLFVYGYTNGIRSDLSISVWDSTSLNWRLIDQGNFASTSNGWLAAIYTRERVYYNGTMPSSEIYYEYDSLNRMMHYSEQLTPFDTAYSGITMQELNYTIYNNQKCLTRSVLGENYLFDPSDPSTYLYYATYYYNYHYDSEATYLGYYYSGYATGFISQILTYDSLGHLVHFYDHRENHSGQQWETIDTFYFYSNPNILSFCIPPNITTNTSTCPSGSVVGSELIAIGGCGPITYEWLPNTSTVNVGGVHPGVLVQDTATYILVAHDQTGLTDTTFLYTAPAGERPLLQYTPVCSGGYQLALDPSPVSNWYSYTTLYHNNLLVSYFIDTISSPGDYYAIINYEDAHCIQYSDTISITSAYEPLLVSAGVDTTLCAGQSVILGGLPTASGGISPISYQWSPATGLSSSTDANPVVLPWVSTVYELTATDSVGCNAVAQVSIEVGDTTTPTLNLINGWLTTESGADFYEWYYNGQLLAASNNLFQLAAIAGGDYQVVLTDYIGCTRSTPVYHYSSTGTNNFSSSNILAFPNPTDKLLFIDFPSAVQKPINYILYDALGRIVMNSQSDISPTIIDMTTFSAGLYTFDYIDANGKTGKIRVAKNER